MLGPPLLATPRSTIAGQSPMCSHAPFVDGRSDLLWRACVLTAIAAMLRCHWLPSFDTATSYSVIFDSCKFDFLIHEHDFRPFQNHFSSVDVFSEFTLIQPFQVEFFHEIKFLFFGFCPFLQQSQLKILPSPICLYQLVL